MVIAGLLLTAAGLTADADASNLAYTQCLFATSRAANEARLSVGAFEERLATACRAEQRVVERSMGRVFAQRGERDGTASAHRLAEEARRGMVDTYRRTLELEPQLRKIGEICRANPDQCRD
jgi:hypothetical protein